MLKRFVRGLFRSEGQEHVGASPKEQASFVLVFDGLEIGVLTVRDGVWEFKYSSEFRKQADAPDRVLPLIDFPDVAKVYRSEDLWPFFMSRIPSVAQPKVIEEIERRGLDQTSAPELLRAFGERSIANPFRLIPT